MPIYVIDAYGLSAIGDLVAEAKLKSVLHRLTDMVKDGALRFPDSVWREACTYMDEHGLGLWAKTVFGHISKDASTWEHEDKVLDAATGLVDPDATEYQTQVDVAKVAVWQQESDESVIVVTGDIGERPDRLSLGEACDTLGIDYLDTGLFLDVVIPFDYS